MRTYGLCVAMPGLIDYTEQRGLLSPNVHITDGQTPAHRTCRSQKIGYFPLYTVPSFTTTST